MKALYRISIFLNVIAACFLLMKGSELLTKDYLSGQTPKTEAKDAQTTQDAQTINAQKTRAQWAEQEERAQTSAAIETAAQPRTTCDTAYVVTCYDLSAREETAHKEKLPSTYIGKTREQLLVLLEDYNRAPPLEVLEEGFVSLELVSFSAAEIHVKKIIESEMEAEPLYFGCIVAEDGFLTVYDEKRENVILYTDISLFSLPEEQQQEILDGKYMETQEQLYNLLESYSS